MAAPVLTLITFLPAAAGLALSPLKAEKGAVVRWGALGASLAVLVLAVMAWTGFDVKADPIQLRESCTWIPLEVPLHYTMGIDGISLALIVLTAFLMPLAIRASWHQPNGFFIALLFLETGMMGAFCALDLFLFYVFWEVMLIPMYFLIGIWGGPRRIYASVKFFLFTLLGSVLMLIGIIALYVHHAALTGVATFDIRILQSMGAWPDWLALQVWVWLAFFLGFAIKVPMFPFHTWLPDAHVEAPTAGSVILAGVLLKMGIYGFLRFSLPMLPDATRRFAPFVLTLCVIGVIYGAAVALVQKDWKKLVAYSSISHLGFCMLGVFALNYQGLTGGVLQMINHGLSTGALFLLVGVVYERRHTRQLGDYGGLAKVMPWFAVIFMIMTLSSIGMPLIPGNGFTGEWTILVGVFGLATKAWAILGATGLVLGATYMLWLYQRTMFGKLDNEDNRQLADLSLREFAYLVPLVALAFWIGIRPEPFFRVLDEPVQRLVSQVEKTAEYPRGVAGTSPRLSVVEAGPQPSMAQPGSR